MPLFDVWYIAGLGLLQVLHMYLCMVLGSVWQENEFWYILYDKYEKVRSVALIWKCDGGVVAYL